MPISNICISKILNKIRLLNQYEEDDIDLIRYSLEAILWEIEKTIIMFVGFLLIGYHNYYLMSLFVVATIRPLTGGYHSKTALGCVSITFIGLFFSIVILPNIAIHDTFILMLSIFSLVITILTVPMKSLERAAIQKLNNPIHKKVMAFFITLGWLIFVFTNKNNTYAYSILWLIVLQNFQLLFEYIRRKRKGLYLD